MNQKQYHSLEELPLMMNMTDVVAVLAVAVTQVVGDQFDRFGAVGGECRH